MDPLKISFNIVFVVLGIILAALFHSLLGFNPFIFLLFYFLGSLICRAFLFVAKKT
jgi:uncharacterized membrane protein YgaE (UPF0421/DUF939 family)